MLPWLSFAALVGWAGLLLLPWRPWQTREHLESRGDADPKLLADVTVLIPARNEAETIATTLAGVAAQGRFARVVVVDDQSEDDTGALARATALSHPALGNLRVVDGRPPPPGASGKLWALTQGLPEVDTPLVLLLDADIELEPGIIATLAAFRAEFGLALASLMVHLSMRTRWEKLLIPAFVYFFKLLYPFGLANSRSRYVAAAAGGCILLTRESLEAIGGFAALGDALIDDCTLARRIKHAGYRTWVGLTRSARSARPYRNLREIWNMVARTAFTQLGYSWLVLALCTLIMALMFLVPPAAALLPGVGPRARLGGAAALVLMMVSFWPTIRYYRLPPAWLGALPIAGALYLAMTWTSAWRYLRGERSRWKARSYRRA